MSLRPRAFGRLREEQGIALVLSLFLLAFFGIVVTTLIHYTTANTNSTSRQRADQQAYALAEAGLNDAISVLSAPTTDPADPNAVPSTTRTFNTGIATYAAGTATYSGSLSQNLVSCAGSPTPCVCFTWWPTPCIWTLTATGSVRNPVGGTTTPVTREVSQRVEMIYTRDTTMWNYLYSDATTGCMNTNNNAVIQAPLYVRGNLCVANGAEIRGSPLQVEGTLTMGNNAYVRVSPPNNPIAVAKLKLGCTGGNPNPHPCTSSDRVYATSITTTPDGLRKPAVDLTAWYRASSPGPLQACTSGSMPGGFDNNAVSPNGTPDRSRAAFDLTGAAYSCSTARGQISWTPGNPGTLTISGAIFFDGDIFMNNNADAVYSGRGTIYSSGKITLNNGARLCGIVGCTSSWNTAQNVLMLVAGAPSGYSFELINNSVYQGTAYAVADYRLNQNAVNWGPVIANQIQIDNNAGQMLPISEFPPGSPTPTYASLKTVAGGYSG